MAPPRRRSAAASVPAVRPQAARSSAAPARWSPAPEPPALPESWTARPVSASSLLLVRRAPVERESPASPAAARARFLEQATCPAAARQSFHPDLGWSTAAFRTAPFRALLPLHQLPRRQRRPRRRAAAVE